MEVVHGDQILSEKRSLLSSLLLEINLPSSRMVVEVGRRMKQEERLRLAASLSLQLGQLQRYCELLIRLDKWMQALAVAPGVSMAYWRNLSRRLIPYPARRVRV